MAEWFYYTIGHFHISFDLADILKYNFDQDSLY